MHLTFTDSTAPTSCAALTSGTQTSSGISRAPEAMPGSALVTSDSRVRSTFEATFQSSDLLKTTLKFLDFRSIMRFSKINACVREAFLKQWVPLLQSLTENPELYNQIRTLSPSHARRIFNEIFNNELDSFSFNTKKSEKLFLDPNIIFDVLKKKDCIALSQFLLTSGLVNSNTKSSGGTNLLFHAVQCLHIPAIVELTKNNVNVRVPIPINLRFAYATIEETSCSVPMLLAVHHSLDAPQALREYIRVAGIDTETQRAAYQILITQFSRPDQREELIQRANALGVQANYFKYKNDRFRYLDD